MKWIDLDHCPLCGNDDGFTGFARYRSPYKTKDSPGVQMFVESVYYKCNECGMVFESPRPTDEDLEAMYGDMTYRNMMVSMNQASQDMNESQRQARVASYIPPGSKLLDVGCSRGYLLDIARRKLGCDVLGVEPNPYYTINGIPTVRTLDEVEGQFDCIACIHVLEHVADFKGMAARIIELLKPGGTLLLEVPHEKSLGMVHIYVFTPDVIQRIFQPLQMTFYDKCPHHFMIFKNSPLDKGTNVL